MARRALDSNRATGGVVWSFISGAKLGLVRIYVRFAWDVDRCMCKPITPRMDSVGALGMGKPSTSLDQSSRMMRPPGLQRVLETGLGGVGKTPLSFLGCLKCEQTQPSTPLRLAEAFRTQSGAASPFRVIVACLFMGRIDEFASKVMKLA